MKFKKTMLFSIIATLMLGCAPCLDYEVIARQIRSQTAKELKKEKDLIPVGTMGQMMGDIQAIGLSFQYFHLVNLEEARELLVDAIQVFLRNINENKKIRPYLHNYPFTTKNIEIIIWIYQPDRSKPPLENLQCLSVENGILTYGLVAPSRSAPYPILHEETYEEALKILAEKS